jgi:hypothetical protein
VGVAEDGTVDAADCDLAGVADKGMVRAVVGVTDEDIDGGAGLAVQPTNTLAAEIEPISRFSFTRCPGSNRER